MSWIKPTPRKIRLLEATAKCGDSDAAESAALQLTHIYFSANDEPNLIKWAEFAAKNYENTKALMTIANYYKVKAENKKMLYYLKWAVDLGWNGACKQMALYYKVRDDKMNMIKYANLGTSYGCSDCAKMMADYYENLGCPDLAIEYYRAIKANKQHN